MRATICQLRSATKEILNAVGRGSTVWVTNHGKTCAKIVPVAAEPEARPKDEAFGMWKNYGKTRDVRSYVRHLRKWRRAL